MGHAASSRILTVLPVVALLLAGCAGDASDDLTTPTVAPTTATTSEHVSASTEAPSATTTTVAPSATVPATTTSDDGEPVDFGPVAGDVLGVVGVAYDDVLNVRSGPGVGHGVIAELDPTYDDVVARGNTRSLDDSLWIEVDAGGVEGWVNLSYVGYLGDTSDTTSQTIEVLGEAREVETMFDLGILVARTVGGGTVDVVMSVAPSFGDLGEVTFDVLGFEDDSVRGARVHVFGTPSESGEGFILKSVESTAICARGISDGLCA